LARTLQPHLTISWFSLTASYLSACLHNLTTSQPSKLDPEDGGGTFLREVGSRLQNYTVQKPEDHSANNHPRENLRI